ncbi:MAG: DUF2283 domain-containing protein [bacterium]|nr:DUF2283 domain-containing protein [bacterium]
MVKIAYDKRARILSLRLSAKKSVDSEVEDTIVIDRDKDGSIVNVDIMDVGLDEFQRTRTHVSGFARTRVGA